MVVEILCPDTVDLLIDQTELFQELRKVLSIELEEILRGLAVVAVEVDYVEIVWLETLLQLMNNTSTSPTKEIKDRNRQVRELTEDV